MDISILFIIIALAYIWFDTDAVQEYLSFFGFKFHKFEEWKELKKSGSPFDYQNFLLFKHNNLFTRLITCPYCVIVWMNFLSLPFVPLKWVGIQIVSAWVGYFALKKILKKLNE